MYFVDERISAYCEEIDGYRCANKKVRHGETVMHSCVDCDFESEDIDDFIHIDDEDSCG